MKQVFSLILAVLTALLLTGCQTDSPPVSQPPVSPMPVDQEVCFEIYAAWAETQSTPGITFSGFERQAMSGDQYTLITVHRGECPSTGYALRIDRILTDGEGRYRVHVTLLDPDPELPQSEVLTYPFATVLIEGHNPDASFEMVVDDTLIGPHDVAEVFFLDYTESWIAEEDMLPGGGVLFLPLVAQTSAVDTAIAVYREECPTTGYDIEITRVTLSYDGLITLHVVLTDPEPGSEQAQVITQPRHSIRIEGNNPKWRYTFVIDE